MSENFDFEGKLYCEVPINFAGGEMQQVKRVSHTEKDYIIVFPLFFKCYKLSYLALAYIKLNLEMLVVYNQL